MLVPPVVRGFKPAVLQARRGDILNREGPQGHADVLPELTEQGCEQLEFVVHGSADIEVDVDLVSRDGRVEGDIGKGNERTYLQFGKCTPVAGAQHGQHDLGLLHLFFTHIGLQALGQEVVRVFLPRKKLGIGRIIRTDHAVRYRHRAHEGFRQMPFPLRRRIIPLSNSSFSAEMDPLISPWFPGNRRSGRISGSSWMWRISSWRSSAAKLPS
jgi:hypothetical protein